MGDVATEGLNVRELLKNTYSRLVERHRPKEIVLPKRVLTEIANDSDWHRTRVGYMGYESEGLFQFDGKTWAIARGEKCGSYPSAMYDSDILALEFELRRTIKSGRKRKKTDKQIQEELSKRIEGSTYFRNSIVFGLADGLLAVGEDDILNRFAGKVKELLVPHIGRFIAQKPEYDKSLILLSTLQHPPKKVVLYRPEFVDFLADSIETILREQYTI